MAERPILIFPAATVAARAKLPQSFGPPGPRPTQAQQKKRLAARFQALTTRFGTIQADTGGIDPEQVIVFETVGSLTNFQNVVKKIPGMEWLGDFDADIADPDPGFLADGTDATRLPGRLFVVVANRTAFAELQKLWRAWIRAKDEKLPRGFGPLAEVFKHLQDVRPWGPKDRVAATGVIAYWERGLAANQPAIRFEAELWCRADQSTRNAAYGRLQAVVTQAGGQCIKRATLSEIDYDGVLLELPAVAVRQAIEAIRSDRDTAILRLTDVKYFAPMGQASLVPIAEGEPIAPSEKPLPAAEPVAALLDGLPLTNHAALQGRLIVDDPDGFAAKYQTGEHRHGTAMASLITHGEVDAAEPALTSKLYVRPLMYPDRPDDGGRRDEWLPSDELTVDLVHRAVRRILEGDGDQPAQAPTVKIINLSIGDLWQPFDRHLSPWARLIDWLAWKYQVLFVISASNHLLDISIPSPPSSISSMADNDIRAHTLRSMAHQRLERRLLAPSEAVNALTVGALHAQAAPIGNPGQLVDLLRGALLPSPVSTLASGFRRAIKPEILVPGGRRHYSPALQDGKAPTAVFRIANIAKQPGQLVAAPGGTAIPPNHAVRISGTSNAAALTTRKAVQLADEIAALRQEPGGDTLSDARTAVIIKAMFVHGATWGEWEPFVESVFDGPDDGMERWWRIKRDCARLLGYGPADFDRGTVCTDQRVILLGCNELRADEAHIYNVPLPAALHAQTIQRRLTITLAWLTPTNPRHRNYCTADLWFDPPDTHLQVKRADAGDKMVKQGTVQHEVLEGSASVPIADGDTMPIQVNCRADATSKLSAPIPYALMVSLETARPLAVSIYQEVRVALERIREASRIRSTVRAGRRSR
jgi:hypothetical protein